ncbi:DUF4148 domain-containing protein [Burkholderia anthinoferrum]|uniref:DUF4148 domain-containing protein n=1 Tax=Burkholderia anthinoferrum TaxID=3090833 RepID=UPI000CE1FBA7|nr:DUF4148 domain-containing protein [Burkholderia anthinoferrum]RQZ85899.1 DUF4148 domain-containing protein [Burkholderia cenocepacia]RRA05548.1 DUF4148 domain-containing protein [Burkholderia cenocepacia]
MKTLACVALVLGTLTAPALSFAQSNTPLTRAQVRADLVRVERAGYNPATGNDPQYPADIQAAEAKVAAEQQTGSGYGSAPTDGTSASGKHAHAVTHASASCVGPASFCNPYFGS